MRAPMASSDKFVSYWRRWGEWDGDMEIMEYKCPPLSLTTHWPLSPPGRSVCGGGHWTALNWATTEQPKNILITMIINGKSKQRTTRSWQMKNWMALINREGEREGERTAVWVMSGPQGVRETEKNCNRNAEAERVVKALNSRRSFRAATGHCEKQSDTLSLSLSLSDTLTFTRFGKFELTFFAAAVIYSSRYHDDKERGKERVPLNASSFAICIWSGRLI